MSIARSSRRPSIVTPKVWESTRAGFSKHVGRVLQPALPGGSEDPPHAGQRTRPTLRRKIAPHPNIMTPESTRVLVVEDNVFDQQLLKEHLSSRGYLTEFAYDGAEALPKLEADPLRYDVVLLDRSMP